MSMNFERPMTYRTARSLSFYKQAKSRLPTHLRDTLAVLSSVKLSPGNSSGVLALKEKRLGFAILETEDLAVATDVELAL